MFDGNVGGRLFGANVGGRLFGAYLGGTATVGTLEGGYSGRTLEEGSSSNQTAAKQQQVCSRVTVSIPKAALTSWKSPRTCQRVCSGRRADVGVVGRKTSQ